MSKKIFPIQTATACQLKWSWTTLLLNTGQSASCHRTGFHELTAENFDNFHNNDSVLADRRQMLKGEWPTENCSYCRLVEQAGGKSDRMLQLDIPYVYPQELDADATEIKVNPTVLEVFYNNTCNLGCLYCTADVSSKIAQENNKFGRFDLNGVVIESETPRHYKELAPSLNRWLTKNFQSLSQLKIVGGEPLLQKELDSLVDLIDEYPNPQCELSLITNLMVPLSKLTAFVDKIKQLIIKKKLRRFDCVVSIDCWGPEQEYVRYGLDLQQWQENFEYLLTQKWITVNIQQVVNPLSIKTMPALLEKLAEWRNLHPIGQYFSGVISPGPDDMGPPGPSFMKLEIFGRGVFTEDFKRILDLMPETTSIEVSLKDHMQGIFQLAESSDINLVEVKKLLTYLNEKDRRRGTNWKTLFPWLTEYEALCGITR